MLDIFLGGHNIEASRRVDLERLIPSLADTRTFDLPLDDIGELINSTESTSMWAKTRANLFLGASRLRVNNLLPFLF